MTTDRIDEFIKEAEKPVAGKKSTKKELKEKGWIYGSNGFLVSRLKNIKMLFAQEEPLRDLFQYNEFTGDIIFLKDAPWGGYKGETLKDADDVHIKGYFSDNHHFEPSVNLIKEAVWLEAYKHKTHPVKEYLEGLKWDGRKRLDTWLVKTVHCEDNEYTNLVGVKMLCAMIRRIYVRGCKYDYMVIFEGQQGIFKSTMLEVLGGQWYAPLTELANHKEAVDVMRGKWVLEVEELAAMRKADLEHIKAFLSRRVDRTRLSYGRRAEDFPRQSVICGTMNPIGQNEYFKDASGNRRFWPIHCAKRIELQWLKDHRDQLFAEAMTRWENEPLYLDNKLADEIAIEEQEKRKVSDAWEDVLNEFLVRKDYVVMEELTKDALKLPIDRVNQLVTIRIGIIMRQFGWDAKRYGRKQKRYFVRPGVDLTVVLADLSDNPAWDEGE